MLDEKSKKSGKRFVRRKGSPLVRLCFVINLFLSSIMAAPCFGQTQSTTHAISTDDHHWIIQPNGQIDIGPEATTWSALGGGAAEEGITGDITLSNHRIVYGNGAWLSISRVKDISAWPMGPNIYPFSPNNPWLPAELFKVDKPENTRLPGGWFETRWIVVMREISSATPVLAGNLILFAYSEKTMPTPNSTGDEDGGVYIPYPNQ